MQMGFPAGSRKEICKEAPAKIQKKTAEKKAKQKIK